MPLQAYGPPGLDAMTTALLEAYREDIRVRVEGPEQLRRDLLAVETHEIEPGLIYEDAVMRVEAFAVPHGTWDHAFGFKLTTADRTIVISGDTGPFEGLAEIAAGADVLIHEAYGADGLRWRQPETQLYHGTFHTSAVKVGEIAAEAGVGMVILHHQLHLAGGHPGGDGRAGSSQLRRRGGVRARPRCVLVPRRGCAPNPTRPLAGAPSPHSASAGRACARPASQEFETVPYTSCCSACRSAVAFG